MESQDPKQVEESGNGCFFGKMKPGRSKWVHNQSTSRVTVNDKRIHLACMIIPQENYGIDHQLSRSNMVKPHLSLSIVKRERERESGLTILDSIKSPGIPGSRGSSAKGAAFHLQLGWHQDGGYPMVGLGAADEAVK